MYDIEKMKTILANPYTRVKLSRRVDTYEGNFYYFLVDNKPYRLNETESIALVQNCSSAKRNCRTDGTRIYMKAGCGNMPHEDRKLSKQDNRHLRSLAHGFGVPNGVNILMGPKYRKVCNVFDNTAFFDLVQCDGNFLKKQAGIIKQIDEATIIDYNTNKIETPFGIGSVGDLSTGLKTLLNVLYLKEHSETFELVCIDECGDNILPYIFEAANNTNIALYLNHVVFELPKGYVVYANRQEVKTPRELMAALKRSGALS